jgi:hypothetical protein
MQCRRGVLGIYDVHNTWFWRRGGGVRSEWKSMLGTDGWTCTCMAIATLDRLRSEARGFFPCGMQRAPTSVVRAVVAGGDHAGIRHAAQDHGRVMAVCVGRDCSQNAPGRMHTEAPVVPLRLRYKVRFPVRSMRPFLIAFFFLVATNGTDV